MWGYVRIDVIASGKASSDRSSHFLKCCQGEYDPKTGRFHRWRNWTGDELSDASWDVPEKKPSQPSPILRGMIHRMWGECFCWKGEFRTIISSLSWSKTRGEQLSGTWNHLAKGRFNDPFRKGKKGNSYGQVQSSAVLARDNTRFRDSWLIQLGWNSG